MNGGWARSPEQKSKAFYGFLLTGLVGIIAGVSITAFEQLRQLPWSVTVPLTIVAVFGVLAAPAYGFWLVLVVAIVAIARSARWGGQPTPIRS